MARIILLVAVAVGALAACSCRPAEELSSAEMLPDGVRSKLVYTDPLGPFRLYCDSGQGEDSPRAFHVSGTTKRIRGLSGNPAKLEEELRQGTWLVAAAGVTNLNDRIPIANAVRAVEARSDGLMLGLRPYVHYHEATGWFGPYGDIGSPLWVFIKDGKIIHGERGPRTQNEVTAMIDAVLSRH